MRIVYGRPQGAFTPGNTCKCCNSTAHLYGTSVTFAGHTWTCLSERCVPCLERGCSCFGLNLTHPPTELHDHCQHDTGEPHEDS